MSESWRLVPLELTKVFGRKPEKPYVHQGVKRLRGTKKWPEIVEASRRSLQKLAKSMGVKFRP